MIRFNNLLKQQKGFTLVELLVVVAIIGILAAIAIPKFVDSTSAANGARVLSDLQSLDSAIQQYSATNGASPSALSDVKSFFAGDTLPVAPKAGSKVKINGIVYDSADYGYANGRATFSGKNATELSTAAPK